VHTVTTHKLLNVSGLELGLYAVLTKEVGDKIRFCANLTMSEDNLMVWYGD
jgi:hypothetical protein